MRLYYRIDLFSMKKEIISTWICKQEGTVERKKKRVVLEIVSCLKY